MKFIVLVLCVIAFSDAEPPSYRSARIGSKLARVENVPATDVEPLIPDARDASASGPYPPSGWRPTGARFELPSPSPKTTEETSTPAAEYLPAEYGLPAAIYGPPSNESTESTEESTTSTEATTTEYASAEEATTPPPETEGSGAEEDANLVETIETLPPNQQINQQGSYYLLLPNDRLQKILYSVQQDPEKLQLSSRLQSASTQSLAGPLVFYTPQYVQLV